jgi:hypothetical protein
MFPQSHFAKNTTVVFWIEFSLSSRTTNKQTNNTNRPNREQFQFYGSNRLSLLFSFSFCPMSIMTADGYQASSISQVELAQHYMIASGALWCRVDNASVGQTQWTS